MTNVKINETDFKLLEVGESIETVNVEKYNEFYNPDKEEHEFDLDFPYDEEFSLKDYKPLTKDYVENHLSVAAFEEDDYGDKYVAFTDYWYICLRKVEDMTEEQLEQYIEDNDLDNVVVIYDNENKLWIVETNED